MCVCAYKKQASELKQYKQRGKIGTGVHASHLDDQCARVWHWCQQQYRGWGGPTCNQDYDGGDDDGDDDTGGGDDDDACGVVHVVVHVLMTKHPAQMCSCSVQFYYHHRRAHHTPHTTQYTNAYFAPALSLGLPAAAAANEARREALRGSGLFSHHSFQLCRYCRTSFTSLI